MTDTIQLSLNDVVRRVGLPADEVDAWVPPAPAVPDGFPGDAAALRAFVERGVGLEERLPGPAQRGDDERAAAAAIDAALTDARAAFLAVHAEELYDRITQGRSRHLRLEQVVYDAAVLVPGLVPTPRQMEAERARPLVQEDHFLVEVIDPERGVPVAPGEEGELTFTTLTKEALPLIRYRTGDLGRLVVEPCPCGRTTVRITGLRGRRDDMLIVRGVNLHPSEVERILLEAPGATSHYQLIVERTGLMDELRLECEPQPGADHHALQMTAERRLQEETGLRIAVAVVNPGRVPRSEGKAVRVLDRRPR